MNQKPSLPFTNVLWLHYISGQTAPTLQQNSLKREVSLWFTRSRYPYTSFVIPPKVYYFPQKLIIRRLTCVIGQQYLYAEDILMCDEGLNSTEPIPIPPAKVLYAAPNVDSSRESTSDYDRETWARAHLLPITVPADVPELLVLSQDREEILAGIRSGFAAAYDALSPVVGLQAGPDSLDGMKIAELVFPEVDAPHESVLEKQIPLAGEKLGNSLKASKQETISTSTPVQDSAASVDLSSAPRRYKRFRKMLSSRRAFRRSRRADDHAKFDVATSSMPIHNDFSPPAQDADAVLPFLPGVQLGSIPMVAERFQAYFERQRYTGNKV